MHRHVKDQIDAYLSPELDVQDRRAFDQHVASCPGCKNAFQEAAQAQAYLQWLAPSEAPPKPGPGFYARLQQSIETRRVSSWFGDFAAGLHPRLAYPLLGFMVLLVAWTLTFVYPREGSEPGLAALEFSSTEFVSFSFSGVDRAHGRDLVILSLVEPLASVLPDEMGQAE